MVFKKANELFFFLFSLPLAAIVTTDQAVSALKKKKRERENYIFSLQGGRDSGIEDPHQTVYFL